jgi:transposase
VLTRPAKGRIFVASAAADLRKSFNGLTALVEGTFGQSMLSGDLFVFLNRRATQVRILYWDSDGYCIWMKRLEAGTFRCLTSTSGADLIEVDTAELAMLLAGIDAPVVKRRKRYRQSHNQDNVSVAMCLQS